MLHILLLILKIIGIILAVILGILILLILMVLFVPIRYHGAAKWDETWEHFRAQVQITWLLRIFEIRFVLKEGRAATRIRIAWKKLGTASVPHASETPPSQESEETVKDSLQTGKEEADEKEQTKTNRKESEKTEKKEQTDPAPWKADQICQKTSEETVSETHAEKNRPRNEEKGSAAEEKPSRLHSIIQKLQKLFCSIRQKIKCTFRSICDKMRLFTEKKEQVLAFLEDEDHKKAYQIIKKEGIRLLKSLSPKQLYLNLYFGFEDPYHTGQMLAFLAAVYPFVPGDVSVCPDFEKKIFRGKAMVKGKLRVIHFVFAAFQLFRYKAVRKTYRDIRGIFHTEG